MTLSTLRFCLCIAAVIIVTSPAIAEAATRTVCFRVQFRDERIGCPTPTTIGVKRACDPAADYSDFVGGHVELMDKDSGDSDGTGIDDRIGTWIISSTGNQCATFDWEGAPYNAEGEAHPDIYINQFPRVSRPGDMDPYVQAVNSTGGNYIATTYRNSGAGYVAIDCASGTTCWITSTMFPTTSSTSNTAVAYMMIDSAQRVLQEFGSLMENNTIKAWYPVVNNPNNVSCANGLVWDRTNFCLPSGKGNWGDLAAHEMGHVVHMQMFHQDILQKALTDNDGDGQLEWNMGNTSNSNEWESGAMTEGFGAYVGAVAWYDPANTNASFQPSYSGVNLEPSVGAISWDDCMLHRWRPRNVAKAFWDLDDAKNEPGEVFPDASDDDHCSVTTTSIAANWEAFADGTADRQDFETGNNGVNAWDYDHYFPTSGCDRETTFVTHNCLQASEFN